jgi:hypothetical protein
MPTLFRDGVVYRAGRDLRIVLAAPAPTSRPAGAGAEVGLCSYLMMRPPSAHSTWPVIVAAAASEAR